jgi:serine phosphatase RsbU (regulator of sigma subunit)
VEGGAAIGSVIGSPFAAVSARVVGDPVQATAAPATRRRLAGGALTLVVVLVGVSLSVALGVVLERVHDDNEARLLQQRTLEAAAVLMAAVPGIESPLASAAEFSEATDGDVVAPFRRLFEPIVERATPFVAASIWQINGTTTELVDEVGVPLKLSDNAQGPVREQFFARAIATDGLTVTGFLGGDDPRLGYAYTTSEGDPHYLVYAEGAVRGPTPREPTPGTAFEGLHNAIYLGAEPDSTLVLATDSPQLPLDGLTASQVVDFGDSKLLLVMSRRGELGGGFFAAMPWLVAAVTLAATAAAAAMTHRLARRRRAAEDLAGENAALYDRQRVVAHALQRAILPERLPTVEGLAFAGCYIAGVDDLEVGGDFYDVFVDDDRVVTIVGDVSGRGVDAATVMAKARHAFRALASRGDTPADILAGLSKLIDIHADRHFATVICASIDAAQHRLTVANAGHPRPLLVEHGRAAEVPTSVGLPIGVDQHATYTNVDVAVPPHATILMFTDGLFERRGETIDDGFARIASAASVIADSVDDLVNRVVRAQHHASSRDDIAILGVTWTA